MNTRKNEKNIQMTSLIESSRVAPPPGAVADRTLSLTFLDICWLHFHPIRRLLFYEYPCSKSYFLDTLVPRLKHSLSLALKHFFPLAGNLVYPSDTEKSKPVIRYVSGDSVPLSIFESTNDFDTLVGNQPRDADAFYDYIPHLPPIVTEPDHNLLQVLSLRVTLFPGRGICIGIANHHSVGDASSIVGFIRAWASICKSDSNEEYLEHSRPIFERDLIKDPLGLESIYWNQMKQIPFKQLPIPLPTNRVRATYVLDQARIKKLKDLVMAKFPSFAHPSSFVVASAYIWTCLAKTLVAGDEEENGVDENELEFFLFAADIRARLDPPLPASYFGNCLSGGLAKVRHEELIGPDGFFIAARAAADEIKNKLSGMDKIMARLENALEDFMSLWDKRLLSVSGSARVDLYGADFGLGRARKIESLSIDGEKYAMSLCKPRDCEGGLEIGLSLPKEKMDVFYGLFNDGLV